MPTKSVLLGIVRHLLTMGGGALVAAGWLDESTAQQTIGAVVTLVGVVWSVLEKRA